MRQIISTAIVAVVVGAVAGATMGAVAQTEPEAATPQAIVPSVSSINAHKVDGRHAVSASASKAKRAGKLVATNKQGYLPSNIVKPKWSLIRGKPAVLADGKIRWNEVLGKPAGFADGVDDGAFVSQEYGPYTFVSGDQGFSIELDRNVDVQFTVIPTTAYKFLTATQVASAWYPNVGKMEYSLGIHNPDPGNVAGIIRVRLYSQGIGPVSLKRQLKSAAVKLDRMKRRK